MRRRTQRRQLPGLLVAPALSACQGALPGPHPMTIARAPDGSAALALGISRVPSSVVIDADRRSVAVSRGAVGEQRLVSLLALLSDAQASPAAPAAPAPGCPLGGC